MRLEKASAFVNRVTLSLLGHKRIIRGLSDDEAANPGFGPVLRVTIDIISNYTTQIFVSHQLSVADGYVLIFAGNIMSRSSKSSTH